MGVIDFHTHPWLPRYLNPGTVEFIRDISPAVQEHEDALSDPVFAAELLREQGVDRAVVLAEHCRETSGDVRTEAVLEYCAAVPDFFLPFASIHPRLDARPEKLLKEYIAAGARGLKLYPSYQFFHPNDRAVYPLYEVCADAGIPVLMHIGSSRLPGTRLKYCDPLLLDDVAVDFPDLPLVMAHGGRGFWYDRCQFLAGHHPNAYIDVTGLVPERLMDLFPRLTRLADRVIFGSDWPAMPRSVARNVATIRDLGLPESALAAIFGGNARRLLHLD